MIAMCMGDRNKRARWGAIFFMPLRVVAKANAPVVGAFPQKIVILSEVEGPPISAFFQTRRD
jgi:hypothetical protein